MKVMQVVRRFRAPIVCALLLVTAQTVWAQPQRQTCQAAVEYWQGFALLPQMDESRQKIVSNVESAPLDAAARKLVEESGAALTQLHRGSACEACDWGLHMEDGYRMLMPHLAKGRELARLAFLRAREEVAARQSGRAAQDVCDALVLARRLGQDAVVISVLVDDHVEETAVETIAPQLRQLDPAALTVLADRLAQLPKATSLVDSVRVERQIGLETLMSQLNMAPVTDDWRQRLTESLGIGGPENPEPEAQTQLQSVKSPQELAQRLMQLRPLYDQLPDALRLPQDQARSRLDQIQAQAKAIPLGVFVVSNYWRVYDRHTAAQVRVAMLRAAVAVVRQGPQRLKDFPDPATAQPFEYHSEGNGFELRSKFTVNSQPVTLAVQ